MNCCRIATQDLLNMLKPSFPHPQHSKSFLKTVKTTQIFTNKMPNVVCLNFYGFDIRCYTFYQKRTYFHNDLRNKILK